MPTVVMPELTMLERTKSTRRYLPPYGMEPMDLTLVRSGTFSSLMLENTTPTDDAMLCLPYTSFSTMTPAGTEAPAETFIPRPKTAMPAVLPGVFKASSMGRPTVAFSPSVTFSSIME